MLSGKKYFITDSSFSFKVVSGVITDATATNPTGGKGSMTYDDTSKTLKVCDAEVPNAELKVDKKSVTGDAEVNGAKIAILFGLRNKKGEKRVFAWYIFNF